MRLANIYQGLISRVAANGEVRRLLALIAIALSFFAVLILGTIAYAGWSANETATQRERTQVENALNRTIAQTLDEQKSVAWWDNSITNMRPGAVDLEFLDANFGLFLTETYSHDEVFILNGVNQQIYGFRDGERLAPAAFEARRAVLAPVIAEARGVSQSPSAGAPRYVSPNSNQLSRLERRGAGGGVVRPFGHDRRPSRSGRGADHSAQCRYVVDAANAKLVGFRQVYR